MNGFIELRPLTGFWGWPSRGSGTV